MRDSTDGQMRRITDARNESGASIAAIVGRWRCEPDRDPGSARQTGEHRLDHRQRLRGTATSATS